MDGPRSKVKEERLIMCNRFLIGNVVNGFIGQQSSEVLSVGFYINNLGVFVQIGVVLIGMTQLEAVKMIETTANRPSVIRAYCSDFVNGGNMVFPYSKGAVIIFVQYFGNCSFIGGHNGIVTRKTTRTVI
ncbi:hypothetical protein D3C85_1024210 [compost metagenome]